MRIRLLTISSAIALCVSATASAQLSPVLHPAKIAVGTTSTPASSTVMLTGLDTSTGGTQQALWINTSTSEIIRRIIAKADLPSAVAYEDEANTFSLAQTFGAGIQGNSAALSVLGSMTVRDAVAVSNAALGFDNVRLGIVGGMPRTIYEDAGFSQWVTDNSAGRYRFSRKDAAGTTDSIPMTLSDLIYVDPAGRAILPVTSYKTSIGAPFAKINELWAANLRVENLVADETIATTWGRQLIGYASSLLEGISSSATTIKVKHNTFAVNHVLHMESDGKTERMLVTAGPTRINKNANANVEQDSTGYGVTGGTLTRSTDIAYRGGYALKWVTAGSDVQYRSSSEIAGSTTYTCSAFVRRSDGADFSAWSAGVSGFCASASYAVPTQALDAGNGWWRLVWTDTSAASPSSTYQAVILPSGTFYTDALQIEVGSSLTEWNVNSATYTVTRGHGSIGPNSWDAGNAVFDTGTTGSGFWDIYSYQGINGSGQLGPSMVAWYRNSTTATDIEPRVVMGNLYGHYGYGTNHVFGFAAGDYQGKSFTIENTNGIRFLDNGTATVQVFPTGEIEIGKQSANNPVALFTPSALSFCVYGGSCSLAINGTSGSIDMTGSLTLGTAGVIKSGATAFGTGTGYWLDYNSGTPRFRVGTTSGNRLTWDGTDLALVSNQMTIDASGVRLVGAVGSGMTTVNSYGFTDALGGTYALGAWRQVNTVRLLELRNVHTDANHNAWTILSASDANDSAQLTVSTGNITGVAGDAQVSTNTPRIAFQSLDTTTGSGDPVVFDPAGGSLIKRKTNGFTGACAGAPTVVHDGIIVAC